ncbi:MAG: hypothetical protein Kow0077_15370 [Anaerolineae bacterium]
MSRRISIITLFTLVVLLFPQFTGPLALQGADLPQASAQGPANPLICYSVADGGERLHSMNRFDGTQQTAAPNQTLPADRIEAIELNLDNSILWGVDDDTDDGGAGVFGQINLTTGAWTPIGTIGNGSNPALLPNPRNLGDGDALSIDARTNQLWAMEQTGGTRNNAIYRINPTTGAFVPDLFGPGQDYAIVDLDPATLNPCPGYTVDCTDGVNCPNTIDDLAIHPETGVFYAIVNDIVDVTVDWLAIINVDGMDPPNSPGYNATTGLVSVCLVGIVNDGTDNVTDMEGLGVFNDGTFYGTTGSESTIVAQRNTMWSMDVTTATVTRIGTFNTDTDYESVACLTAGANTMSGTVFCEPPASADGTFNTGDTAQPGATVRLYEDNGTVGTLDGSDILLQTTTADGSGNFSFQVGVTGNFLLEMDGSIIPVGGTYTTPLTAGNVHTASFNDYNLSDTGNDFGFTCEPASEIADLAVAKSDSPDPVAPGSNITYGIDVTNVGGTTATNATLTDDLPAGTTFVSLTSAAGWSCTTPAVGSGGTVSCSAASVASGGPYSFTLVVNVPSDYSGPDPIPNAAVVGAENDSNPQNNRAEVTTALLEQPEEVADLAISKADSPDPVTPGNEIIYTINVANVGTITAVNGTMTDTLPAGTTFVSLSEPAGWSCTTPAVGSGGTVSCTNPAVAPGGPYPFSLIVEVPSDYSGPDPIPNTAETGAENDSNPNNNRASVTTALPPGGEVQLQDPALSKAGILERGGLGIVGEQITWIITATNPNSTPITNVVVSDTIRDDMRIDSASAEVGTTSVSGQVVTFNLGTLSPGQSVRLEIVTTIISGPNLPIPNLAILTADPDKRLTAYAEVFGFPTRLPATGYPPAG